MQSGDGVCDGGGAAQRKSDLVAGGGVGVSRGGAEGDQPAAERRVQWDRANRCVHCDSASLNPVNIDDLRAYGRHSALQPSPKLDQERVRRHHVLADEHGLFEKNARRREGQDVAEGAADRRRRRRPRGTEVHQPGATSPRSREGHLEAVSGLEMARRCFGLVCRSAEQRPIARSVDDDVAEHGSRRANGSIGAHPDGAGEARTRARYHRGRDRSESNGLDKSDAIRRP